MGTIKQGMRVASRRWEQPLADSQQGNKPQSYRHMEMNFTNHLNKPRNDLFTKASRKEHRPANTLILVLWDFKQTNQSSPQDFWTTELWDKFKSFHLGEFVKAVIKKQIQRDFISVMLSAKKNILLTALMSDFKFQHYCILVVTLGKFLNVNLTEFHSL